MKTKPKSLRPKLCDYFVSHSHGWSESKPRSSRNPRLIRPIQVEVDADEEDQQGVNEKRRGWSDPLKQRVNGEWERRKKEAEIRERKKMRKTETNRETRGRKN